MGCASCGQRYSRGGAQALSSPSATARRQRIALHRAAVRRQRQEVTSMTDDKQQVVVQPDTPAGVVVSHTEVPVEPATGIAISVITGGEDPSKSLGDTLVKPISVTDGLGQGD